ncbi:hypothetical protein Poli38472_003295 [Pythium oligandrum]|uniref:Cell cycle checkpoint protein RAD1 n=1 Tax=Pythium oligandrum TaxID=41045 RepID=A0A8K1C6J7_PYTOL|nr:hypothetical protein Poli38472_003295 [Pythium oligandrum]|eukprot:TMW57370.1 hypothetical protein Poli38472_003295 [Pythium oligandrum]
MPWMEQTSDASDEERSVRGRRRRDDAQSEEMDVEDTPRDQREKPVLVCTSESVKLLVTLLSCLFQGKKDQRIRCDIDSAGMLFTSHSKGKSLQIKTSLGSELFDTFEFRASETSQLDHDDEDDSQLDTQYSFALNLSALIESLSMFGPASLPTSSLRLSYFAESARLTLLVEDNGVICECAMQVLELESNDIAQLEFESAFEQSAVIGRCIMQSEPLHDAFAELYDLPSAASVAIAMYEDDEGPASSHKCLSLSATSETGSCEIEFARSSSAFIEFFCTNDETSDDGSASATFHVAVLQQAFKALGHSNETFLRMNADGFLSVQHMIESGSGDKAFVDALISPEDTSIP